MPFGRIVGLLGLILCSNLTLTHQIFVYCRVGEGHRGALLSRTNFFFFSFSSLTSPHSFSLCYAVALLLIYASHILLILLLSSSLLLVSPLITPSPSLVYPRLKSQPSFTLYPSSTSLRFPTPASQPSFTLYPSSTSLSSVIHLFFTSHST